MQRSKFKVRSHPFTLVCTVVFLHSKQSFFSLLLKQELLEAYDEEHFCYFRKRRGKDFQFRNWSVYFNKKFIRMPLFLQIYICTTRTSLGQKFLNWSAFYLQFMISHNNNSTPLRHFFANDNAFSLRQCIVEFSHNCNLQTNFYETKMHICNLFDGGCRHFCVFAVD